MAYIRGGKSRTITDGFHVTRDGRVTYKSRSMRSYERKLHRWGRSAAMRTGGPKLTGDRLLKVMKSCCPANLTAQPRFLKGNNACNCSMHIHAAAPLATYVAPDGEHVGMDLDRLYMATPERLAELRSLSQAVTP
jgi:hypothetical protein